jgi:hypothetical protein
MAAPMPRELPVTSATFPEKSKASFIVLILSSAIVAGHKTLDYALGATG